MMHLKRVAGLARQQAARYGRRQLSDAPRITPKPSAPRPVLRSRLMAGLGVGLGAGFFYGIFERSYKQTGSDRRIASEALPTLPEYVDLQPPTSVDAFPPTITVNGATFQALGTGVRTVTFLNLHVYAVGMYIATDDVYRARRILADVAVDSNNVQNWMDLLSDPVKGTNVIDSLLRANVRFAVRIVPTRTTGYGHLRDGFIKSILKRPEAKALQSEEFGEGLNELRRALSRKKKLEKGEVIVWARDDTGGMSAWRDNKNDKELLGSLGNPDVTRLFFLQYLAGSSPSSPSLKDRSMAGLSALAVTAAA